MRSREWKFLPPFFHHSGLKKSRLMLVALGVGAAWLIAGLPFVKFDAPTSLWGDRTFLHLQGRMFLDWPHVLRSPMLGYPDEFDQLKFPFTDFTERIIQFLGTRLSGDVVIGANLYFAMIIALNFATAFFAFLSFKLRRWYALVGALAFAFIPYFVSRSLGHDYLAATYAAPLAFLIVSRVAGASISGSALLQRISRDRVTLLCCVVIATSGVYYSFFALLLWSFIAVGLAIRELNWRYLLAFALPVGMVLAILVPVVGAFFILAGANESFIPRWFGEQVMYGLRVSDAVLGLDYFGLARRAIAQYKDLRGGSEGGDAWPGLLLSLVAILIALFGALLPQRPAWGMRRDRRQLGSILSAYLAFILIFCSPYGLGLLFNLLITPEIRAQNRVAPFLAFATLLLLLWLWERISALLQLKWGRRSGTLAAGLGVAAFAVINGYHSAGALAHAQRHLLRDPAYAAEMLSIHSVLEAAGQARLERVLQLPVMAWPEASKRGFPGYNHLLLFTFSAPDSTRRWSYGAPWGAPGLAKLEFLETHADWSCFLPDLTAIGFDSVMVDRRAYNADELAAWDKRLTAGGASMVSDEPLRRLYRLPLQQGSCSQPVLPLEQWLSAAKDGALEPFLQSGWHQGEPWGRWGKGAQRVLLPTRGMDDDDLVVELVAMAPPVRESELPFLVNVELDGVFVGTLRFGNAMTPEHHRLVVPRRLIKGNPIAALEFSPDRRPVPASRVNPDDTRKLGIGLHSMRLVPSKRSDTAGGG